jgi:hypothetical protein
LFLICSNASKTSRLLWSRTGTPSSIPDSPKSVDGKSATRSRHSVTSSPLRLTKAVPLSAGYESDDSIRLDRANHSAMKQEIMSMKTMLLKLRRVLNEVHYLHSPVLTVCSTRTLARIHPPKLSALFLCYCSFSVCCVVLFSFSCFACFIVIIQQPDEDIVLRVSFCISIVRNRILWRVSCRAISVPVRNSHSI